MKIGKHAIMIYMPKIAIISDSHDNLPNIKKFITYCQKNKINFVIHCGDVTTNKTKKFLTDNLKSILFVEGNAETDVKIKTNRFQKKQMADEHFINFSIGKIKIAACHTKIKALKLAKTKLYHYVFYGHTHIPWQETVEKTQLINPGTLAGMFTPPTFATLDTNSKNLKLILVNPLPYDDRNE